MASTLTRTIFVLMLVASASAAAASPESSSEAILDTLNSATAELKLAKPSSSGSGFSSMILTTMALVAVVGAAAAITATLLSCEGHIKMTAFSAKLYNKLRTQVFGGAKQLLFYALSALSLSPKQIPARPRTTFSLDIKLDPVHLSMDDRRRRSMGSIGSSSLMAATLEPPLIDMLSMTPKRTPVAARTPMGASARSRRSSGSRASPYLLDNHTSSPKYIPGDAALYLPLPRKTMEVEIREQPGTKPGRKPGQKPSLQRLRDAREAAAQKREMVREEEEDEWECDSDWDDVPRAPATSRGFEMDGEDVGCLPSKVLQLPRSMVSSVSTGVYGRSIFTGDFPIPRVEEI